LTAEPLATRLDELLAEHRTWLAAERGLRSNTLTAYERDLRAYAAYLRRVGAADRPAVDERVVEQYVAELRDARDEDGRARYAPASVARALVAVRSFHRFCVDEDLLDADPTADVHAPKVALGIPKALSEPEVLALLRAPSPEGPLGIRDRAILETLYAAGLRISECVGLDRADLDLEDRLVRVLGKGGKERVVPLGRAARRSLDDWLREARPALTPTAAAARRAGDALFLNARAGRLTRQGCWGIVRAHAERVGLADRVSPHVLRHSCATHLLDHGADIRVVQELLGHASVSTTQVYTKVSPERLRAVYDASHPRSRAPESG
jgi:integrase/recombinase XerD